MGGEESQPKPTQRILQRSNAVPRNGREKYNAVQHTPGEVIAGDRNGSESAQRLHAAKKGPIVGRGRPKPRLPTGACDLAGAGHS
jgi:hypothetical protein